MRPGRRLLAVVGTFIALGMPGAAFGVAWPSVAGDFDRSLGDLGVVVAAHTVGYGVVTVWSGRLIAAAGVGRLLAAAGWAAATALVGYLVAGSWALLLLAVFVHGLSGGAFDGVLNAYAALELDGRAMNLMHAGYGVGATVGPWIMAAALVGAGWRAGMALVAAVVGGVAIMLTVTVRAWALSDESPAESDRPSPGRRPVVVLALLLFLVYSGVEVSLGQWSFTLLSEGRGVNPVVAGVAAGGFWGGLTLSRLVMGAVGGRLRTPAVLLLAGIGALAATALLWWAPVAWFGIVALVVAGFALGPIFPLQMSLTPGRVGRRAAPAMIGYQIAAATVGAGSLPWLIGRSVDAAGIESVGAIVTIAAMVTVASDLALRKAADGG
jgi:fucose permease